MRSRRLVVGSLVGAGLIVLTVLASAVPAGANFGDETSTPPNGLAGASLANNKWHAVRRGSANSHMWAAVSWAVSNSLDPTDMVAYTTSTDPYPDVWVESFNGGADGPWARVVCPVDNSGYGGTSPYQWCRGQLLEMNFFTSFSGNWGRFVGCHELGHTVGLRHTSNSGSCMRQLGPNHGTYPLDYSSHDKAHINGWY